MDSVTQIVLGAAVGEAVLGRKVGNKAMLWGAIGGTIPDLDVIGRYFLDDITALEWHRGFSHSFMFSLIMAPIFGWIIHQLYKKRGEATLKGWVLLMFMAFVTHPLLDCHTTWGTQFLWPFDLRIAYNNIFVIDPLYTIPFLVFLIMAMRQNRVSPKRKKYNTYGLVISSIYMAITLLVKGITFHQFTSNLKDQKIAYTELSTRPTPFNSILWTANVNTKDSFLTAYYSLFDGGQKINFISYPKNHHLLKGHENDDQIKRLIKICKGWYLLYEVDGQMYMSDLRFGAMGESKMDPPGFVFTHKLHLFPDGYHIEQIDPSTDDMGENLKSLFKRIVKKPI
ncbi:MAG: inner membrane protein [Bacteroidia bacterium]|jgi:inner membrane protein